MYFKKYNIYELDWTDFGSVIFDNQMSRKAFWATVQLDYKRVSNASS